MNIEDLIKKRSEELDQDRPPDDLWGKIHKDWRLSRKPMLHVWKVAAMVLLSISLGLIINNVYLRNEIDELATLGDISDNYREMENTYITQINQMESLISLDEVKSNEDLSWLIEELIALEEVNKVYRKDIGSIQEELLINALIDYYEKKIRLLKKIELEIKRTNKFKENEETNTDNISL